MNEPITLSPAFFDSLAEELSCVAKSLANVSKKLKMVSQMKTISISKSTDPDMFTDEFLSAVRKSREEFEKNEFSDYKSIRSKLAL